MTGQGRGGRVALEVRGAVAEFALTSPQRHQAIDMAWVDELLVAVDACEQTEGVRAVLVRSDGARFTVGGDLAYIAADLDDLPATLQRMIGGYHEGLRRLGELPVPVVCAVQGPAAGGGLGLLWCADEVLLASDAIIACGFSRLGLSGDGGSSWALPRLVGPLRAQQLLMGGRTLDAQEALTWGLATQVVAPDELLGTARARAEQYAAGPTAALGQMRRLLRTSSSASWAQHLEAEREAIVATAATDDAREGIAAFLERREPDFRGG